METRIDSTYISNSNQKHSFKTRLLQLIGIIVSPSQTFQSLNEKSYSLGINLYIILTFNFIASYFLSRRVVNSTEFLSILPAELQNTSALAIYSLVVSFFSIFQILLSVLITSAIYLGIYKIFKYKLSFKNIFTIVFLSQLIPILGKIFNSFFMTDSANPVPITSLAFPFYTNFNFPPALLNLLSYVDFFNLWSLVVISIGIAVAAKRSFKNTISIMASILLITSVATSIFVLLII